MMAGRARLSTYACITSLLVIAYITLEFTDWAGNTQLHTLMEVVATLFALIVGVVALVRYYAKPHNMILFIGVGFFGTAMLDGYHAVVTSTFFSEVFPSAPLSLIPWSWNASRTFLAILMFLSWWAWRREEQLGVLGRINEITVYIGVAILTLASFCFFVFVPLGRAYFPEFIFGRPEEFVSAAFFAAALVGYLSKQEWRQDALEHWIVNSLIVGFLCQTIFMSRSYGLFDAMFDMAHALKVVSYGCVFVGLLTEIQTIWRQEQQLIEQRTAALARSRQELEFAHIGAATDVEAGARQAGIIRESGDDASGIESFDEALDLWAQQARSAIGAHQSAVSFIPHGDFKEGKHAVSLSDKYEQYRTYDVLANGDGIWALVVNEKLSFCLTDEQLKSHAAWKNFSDLKDSRGLEHPPMRGWLAVPILSRVREFVGVLQLSDKIAGDFTERDLALAQRLAQLMAPAFSLQYLNEEAQHRSEELAAANQQLAREQYLLNSLVDNIPDPVFFKDRDGRFIRANNAMARDAGLNDPSELVGKTDADIWVGELPSDTAEDERRILETGEPLINKEEQPIVADGPDRWVLVTKMPLRNEAGATTGIFGVARDITERKQQEQERERHSAALAEAKEALERSNADLQQFAYVASHDLQEPLRAVAGYCQLLETKLSDNPDEDVRTFLGHAGDGARRMQSLISSLLDYARVETIGKEFAAVDTREVLNEALSNLQVAIRESAAEVTSDRMPTVLGDRDQLARLFQNLVGNAIKFRGDEAPRIEVVAKEDADHWRFSVRDNGIGLEPQYAERIFVIFQRLHTRSQYPGTGLGLAITKRIVERHGGQISVESKPGEGSTFFFTLPRMRAI
ncbi:MAG: hypothetical protein CMJ64_08200 [Planctomycetaceae bacterium]|nr:hypothetical protein [Planctomycetaceae bacterium]